MSEGRIRLRRRQAIVERSNRRRKETKPPRNAHDYRVRRQSRGQRHRMDVPCRRHHSGRALCLLLPTFHRPLEAIARILDLSVQSLGRRENRGLRHSQPLVHREHIASHARRHAPRGCLANPKKSWRLRQNAQLGLQYPAMQSVRHNRSRPLRRRMSFFME